MNSQTFHSWSRFAAYRVGARVVFYLEGGEKPPKGSIRIGTVTASSKCEARRQWLSLQKRLAKEWAPAVSDNGKEG